MGHIHPERSPGWRSILGKLKVGEDTNSQYDLLQVCQRDTFRHLEAAFSWSALGHEETNTPRRRQHTYEVKYIGGKDRDDMIGVKSKAPFSPNLVFILGFIIRQEGRWEEGSVCTWSRSRHHIPERPQWSHSVSRVSSKHSISVSSDIVSGIPTNIF